MALETELKFLEVDFKVLRQKLKDLGADYGGRFLERNAVFDDGEARLREKNILLRLRKDKDVVLTLKRPAGREDSRVKVREEFEVRVEDFDATKEILHGLGYEVWFWYEKVREKWRLGACEVCLDSLSFGQFVEIEGPETEISALAVKLRLDKHPASAKTYHELNLEYQKANRLPLDHNFVFEPGAHERLLRNSDG
ncbi:MAG: class IV adenylate cyclase [Thermodesulfobacteriota bacterium]|nr:class IV adenylate cyclase [Thermodesulfobacteriota bacterium]